MYVCMRICASLTCQSVLFRDRKNLYNNALRLMKLAMYDGDEGLSFQ